MSNENASFAGRLSRAVASALRQWPLAFALYLPTLFLGLLSAIPIFFASQSLGALGPWPARLAEGDIVNSILELTTVQAGAQPPTEVRAAIGSLSLGVLVVVLAIPLQGLLYNLLVGGVLARVAGKGDSFWPSARHWAWPMVRFGFVSFWLFVLLAGVGLVLIEVIPVGQVGWWIKPLLALAWLAVLNGWLETARASMVVREDEGALQALGWGLGMLRLSSVLGPAVGLWLVLALAGVAVSALTASLVGAAPITLPLAVLVVQQLTSFAGAVLKLARLATGVGVADAAWSLQSPPE